MKTKKNLKNIILISMILSILFFMTVSFAAPATTAKVRVEGANIRETASTDSEVIESASQGEQVEILEEIGEWYRIKYNNVTGYLRQDLVEVTETNTTSEEQQTENTSEVQNTETKNDKNTEMEKSSKYTVKKETKLKITPIINSLDLTTLKENDKVEVIDTMNNWAYIILENGTRGWVILANLEEPAKEQEQTATQENQTQEQQVEQAAAQVKKMYASSSTVNVRESADTASEIVTQINVNTEVTVTSTENGWCAVEVDGKKGYISESLLSTTKQETSRSTMNSRTKTTKTANTTKTATAVTESGNAGSTDVVSYAKQFLGSRYVYGGTSPSGFDCSGFTQYVYKHFGVNLNRTAAAQFSNGTAVSSLQAGDLVMFGKSGISHVGIYIGGNTFIHAANPSKGVRTDSLSSGYYKSNYVGARRVK